MTYLVTCLAELNLLLKCENSQLEQRRLISICKNVLLNAFKVSACEQLKFLIVPKQQLCAFMAPTNMPLHMEANATTCRISADDIPIWNHAGVGHILDLCFRTAPGIQKVLEAPEELNIRVISSLWGDDIRGFKTLCHWLLHGVDNLKKKSDELHLATTKNLKII